MLLSELDESKINAAVANKEVKWHFNPPLAPHFGGAHKSMIKSAKKAINAILGQADISDEELMTANIGAESLIISRPLTYQSANHEDDVPLTPNHFLHGQIGGHRANIRGRDTVQSQETVAPDSGASPALLAQMAERVAARTQCAEKVASGTTRRTIRRGSPSHLARYAAGKMATG